MQSINKSIISLSILGLIITGPVFACVTVGADQEKSLLSTLLGIVAFILYAALLFSGPIFYSLYVKRGGTKRWLITLWGWSFIMIILAMLIKGIFSLMLCASI
jgi:hypothetical protein